MKKFFYIVCSIIVFGLLAVGVFFTSNHFAHKWQVARLIETSLQDSQGNAWQIANLGDKIGIVYFGYTSCPDVCPTALNDLAIALEGLGKERLDFKPIFISVDPARDTPDVIKKYVSHFDKSILGITGSDAQLKSFTFDFGATYFLDKKNPNDKEYLVNHTSNFFLVTSAGHVTALPLVKEPEELQRVLLRTKKRILEN